MLSTLGVAIIFKGLVRVTFWGALAMIATAAVGRIFGVPVIDQLCAGVSTTRDRETGGKAGGRPR